MNKNTIIVAVVVFILVIVGLFAFTNYKKKDLQVAEPDTTPQEEVESDPYNISRIDAKHFFIDGTHTLVGEIVMPTPCDLLDNTIAIVESLPEQVTIDFKAINNSPGQCAQVLTPQRFKVVFDASENASIKAQFMGEDVTLNLVDPEPGETPDDFELFIKG